MEEERLALVRSLKQITAADLDPLLGSVCPLFYFDGAGRRRPVRTALDRLLHCEPRMAYDAAVRFLLDHFADGGEEAALAALAHAATASVEENSQTMRSRSRIDMRIVSGLRQVSEALGCSLAVYAFDPDERDRGMQLFPHGRSVNEWTVDDWAENLPLLKAKNLEGFGIYAFPAASVSDRAVFVVDDAADGKRPAAMVNAYIEASDPNIYLRTSALKTQALFSIPGDPRRGSADYRALLRTVQEENKLHGDPGVNNLRHAFRLPGFFNKKKKYEERPPLVSIIREPHRGPSQYMLQRLAAVRGTIAEEDIIEAAAHSVASNAEATTVRRRR